MSAWYELAATAAEATGNTFFVGVRSKGTWFAHCDGEEVDGDTPEHATRDLVEHLRRRADRKAHTAKKEADTWERARSALAAAFSPVEGDRQP